MFPGGIPGQSRPVLLGRRRSYVFGVVTPSGKVEASLVTKVNLFYNGTALSSSLPLTVPGPTQEAASPSGKYPEPLLTRRANEQGTGYNLHNVDHQLPK